MKFRFFISAAMLLVATSASAQFIQGSKTSDPGTSHVDSYSQLYLQYNPQTLNGENDDESGYNGYLIGLKWGRSLSSTDPFYLEGGFAFQYTSYSKKKVDVNIGTLLVPLNLTYKWAIPNSNVAIAPYAGLNLKGHLWAKEEYGKFKTDYFDDDDMEDNPANRIQLGFQIGLNVGIKSFHVGIGYGKDITDFREDVTFSTTHITVGFDI